MKWLIPAFIAFMSLSSFGQADKRQYFDGEDTIPEYSIQIKRSPASAEVWHIGQPQKLLLNRASTVPNALITDTLLPYKKGDSASFEIHFRPWAPYGIMVLQWTQKLDYAQGDIGKIEVSIDSGKTWANVVDNPWVYNFYGFKPENMVSNSGGQKGFGGRDTSWADIWLCFEFGWMNQVEDDTIRVRFTHLPTDVGVPGEGWILDNFRGGTTLVHTISEKNQEKYANVYPNPAKDRIYIELQKRNEEHYIKEIQLFDSHKRLVKTWSTLPVKTFIQTSDLPPGLYTLRIISNLKTETQKVLID